MTKQEVLEQAGLRLVKVGNLNQWAGDYLAGAVALEKNGFPDCPAIALQQMLADIRGGASSNEGNRIPNSVGHRHFPDLRL
ncbi:hypothetical protein LB543_33785 [Mesorhizobium sp. ESP7-2]|uniref:hypothetical protein n=1 Tax=unclassified Mesorhizobium TaxID=325217 RepID=UPI001CCE16E0|nr:MULTISPECIES: hypothetical protein [unclassified Mesorhizobium]MBZ9674095.1 hypothetical protein [Mesorhizobium sp. ES1-3]MBZ9711646.1 hypothetical protein [Mesorhizobium sp. ESP7-2]